MHPFVSAGHLPVSNGVTPVNVGPQPPAATCSEAGNRIISVLSQASRLGHGPDMSVLGWGNRVVDLV